MKTDKTEYEQNTFIAFPGNNPEYIAYTLSLLLPKYPIGKCILIHLEDKNTTENARILLEVLAQDYPAITVQSKPLVGHDRLVDEDAIHAAELLIAGVIINAKQQENRIHMALEDGDRTFSLIAMTAAQVHFSFPDDHLWGFTGDPEEDLSQCQLLEVPMNSVVDEIQLSHRPPSQKASHYDPQKCALVFERAKPAQRRVLEALTIEPSIEQVAKLLGISVATVYDHRHRLFAYCQEVFELPEQKKGAIMDRYFFRDHFGPFFRQKGQGIEGK